jgi:two-component system alkaline phosphatase synthesis response regulator PhoP
MRVLVIDDDPGVRILCRIAFREEGDEVIEVASGADGLEILEGEGADAVVLDVMLPSVNGFEILRRIRADDRTSDLPVVLLSVRVGIQDQIDGWKAGADEYLTKPFSPSALAAKVNEICRVDPARRADKRAQRLQDRVAAS